MKIRWQQVISNFDINIEYIKGMENLIADILSRAETYKDPACPSGSGLSSSRNHTPTLPPPVVVNYIFISHLYLLPPPTNTKHPNSMPTRRTMSAMIRKLVYLRSSVTRPYHRPQSPTSASSTSNTGLGDIFQQERDRRHQELQQRTDWNERQQTI